MTTPETDFITSPIPESWTEAEAEAPHRDRSYWAKKRRRKAPPTRDSIDMFSACIATAAVSIACGYGWYSLATTRVTSPWLAVALGLCIAVAVRVGGGPTDPQTRGMIALLFYMTTMVVVTYLIARHDFVDLYGSRPGLIDFENDLLRNRLTEPLRVVSWFAGAVVTMWGSKLLR